MQFTLGARYRHVQQSLSFVAGALLFQFGQPLIDGIALGTARIGWRQYQTIGIKASQARPAQQPRFIAATGSM